MAGCRPLLFHEARPALRSPRSPRRAADRRTQGETSAVERTAGHDKPLHVSESSASNKLSIAADYGKCGMSPRHASAGCLSESSPRLSRLGTEAASCLSRALRIVPRCLDGRRSLQTAVKRGLSQEKAAHDESLLGR